MVFLGEYGDLFVSGQYQQPEDEEAIHVNFLFQYDLEWN